MTVLASFPLVSVHTRFHPIISTLAAQPGVGPVSVAQIAIAGYRH